MSTSCLIIDDEPNLRSLYARILALEGYVVAEAASLEVGKKQLLKHRPQVVLLDVRLPDGNGLGALPVLLKQSPTSAFIVLTAQGSIADGVEAMRRGAFDYLVKGDSEHLLLQRVALAAQQAASQTNNLAGATGWGALVGRAPAFAAAVAHARQVAPTAATVLLTGETGTGKEQFARAIHQGSSRAGGPFVAINCAAIPAEMLESELFGYKKGAFTGALADKPGLLAAAKGGTLFLDEIGEMPLNLQAKLLRVLDGNGYMRLGDTTEMRLDARMIAATHRHLPTRVAEQTFRADLYYRLAVFEIALPALRARTQDILLLARHFLHASNHLSAISTVAATILEQYPWPGNIRELRNALERAAIVSAGAEILPEHLPVYVLHPDTTAAMPQRLEELERAHILQTLKLCGGNKSKAAEALGIGIATLYRKLDKYQLEG
ncbi:MAG: sigma-54 dependent transcriptional regulator [Bacteroidetes bacterium]|jgi:two-component system NtrC family response regulator|nr:sigma-54 dependent transcriptional regulator [Bacteroidota bacterium]